MGFGDHSDLEVEKNDMRPRVASQLYHDQGVH